MGRVHVEDLVRYKPVEQHSERGKVLLNGRRRKLALKLLDEGGNVEGLHVGELANTADVAPFRKPACGVQVRLARVAVVDVGGEEFQHAPGDVGRRGESGPGYAWGSSISV